MMVSSLPLPDRFTAHGLRLYYAQGERPEHWSHAALLTALEAYTGRTYTEANILRESGKKPQLRDGTVQFSVTHSGPYWMVCLSPATIPVGLDLQQHKAKYTARVAKRYFHPVELTLLQKAQAERTDTVQTDTALFFDLWCGRESYAKYTGDGITGLDKGYSTTASPIPLTKIDFLPGYSLFLCTKLD